jgi:chlorite dismutase
MSMPAVKLTKGIHVLHLFYRIDRALWAKGGGASEGVRGKIEELCKANSAASNPRVTTYANIGGKADLVFMITAAELGQLGQIHRDIEAAFPAGTLQTVYTFLSITELPDYVTSEEDMRASLVAEKLEPGSEAFDTRLKALKERHAQYEHFRLYPELPDWEVMAFYPMSKRRSGGDNWYSLDFALNDQPQLSLTQPRYSGSALVIAFIAHHHLIA